MNKKIAADRLQQALSATDPRIRSNLIQPVALMQANSTLQEYADRLDRYATAKDTGDTSTAKGLGSVLSPKSKMGQHYLRSLTNTLASLQDDIEKDALAGHEAKVAKAGMSKAFIQATERDPTQPQVLAVIAAAKPRREKAPKEPRPPKVEKPKNECLCGCGALVGNLFAMGHDMKVKGMLRRVQDGALLQKDLPEGVQEMLTDLVVRWGFEHTTDPKRGTLLVPRIAKEKPRKSKKDVAID